MCCKPMKSVFVNYLKRQRDVMVKLKGVAVVFHSDVGLYGTLVRMVLVFVGCESRGSQKA